MADSRMAPWTLGTPVSGQTGPFSGVPGATAPVAISPDQSSSPYEMTPVTVVATRNKPSVVARDQPSLWDRLKQGVVDGVEKLGHGAAALERGIGHDVATVSRGAVDAVRNASQAAHDFFLGPDTPNTDGQGNRTNYYQLGTQYITGMGPRNQVFGQNDPATQILRRDDNLGRLRDRIANGEFPQGKTGNWDQELRGVEGVRNYFKDYLGVPTNGLIGNLADGFLGSYKTHFAVRDIDPEGQATVDMHVFNDSDLKSLTHPPVVGYTPWWQDNVEPHIIAWGPKSGPFSPKRQDFYWTEKIPVRPSPANGGNSTAGPVRGVRP